MELLPSEFSP